MLSSVVVSGVSYLGRKEEELVVTVSDDEADAPVACLEGLRLDHPKADPSAVERSGSDQVLCR